MCYTMGSWYLSSMDRQILERADICMCPRYLRNGQYCGDVLRGGNLLATIEALTEMMYAIAKKVANPALTSVKNLEPFRSCLWPENSSLNRRPTILLATAWFVFSTCDRHQH